MEVVKNLISQLESATSDPVVKLLVICVTILIAITIIAIVFSTIKKIFFAITSPLRKKKNKKPKSKASSDAKKQDVKPEAIQKPVSPEPANPDTHLQEAENLLNILKNTSEIFKGFTLKTNIPDPLNTNREDKAYNAEAFNEVKYVPTAEDTADILKLIENKNVTELEQLLFDYQNKNKTLSVALDADKARYLSLLTEQERLRDEEAANVKTLNNAILNAKKQYSESKTKIAESVQRINSAKDTIEALVVAENNAILVLKQTKEQLVKETAEALPYTDKVFILKSDIESELANSEASLFMYKQNAENSTASLNSVLSDISALIEKGADNSKDLALNQLAIQTIQERLKQAKAEEEARLAEIKAKEEAERLAEEQRKREEEKRRREEIIQREAERIEAEKKAVEQRERERQEQEKARQAALAASVVSQTNVSRETSADEGNQKGMPDVDSEELSADEIAAQAKAMMEAQRKRRAEAAKLKNSQNTPNEPAPSVSKSSTSEDKTDEKHGESTEDVEDNTVTEVKEDTKVKADSGSETPADDPMEALRAKWKREEEIQEALKAGNVDKALNLANKNSN